MRKRRLGLIALLCALPLVMTGCAAWNAPAAKTSETDSFYSQQLTWTPCHGGFECTAVTVPVDWSKPGGATIHIGLVKQPARDGQAKGTIFLNPGGPGASIEDWISGSGPDGLVSHALGASYDIVGYDRPAVGSATRVDCGPDDELGDILFGPRPGEVGSPEWVAAFERSQHTLASACVENTSAELLGHVDTVTSARDLDVARAALGLKRLDYFGRSYGSALGIVYESLFPERTGRVVLDGVVDPTLSPTAFDLGQATGFEKELDAFLTSCGSGPACPLSGSTAAMKAQLQTLLSGLAAQPAPTTAGYVVDEYTAGIGLIAGVSSEQSWPQLEGVLRDVQAGDGTGLLTLAEDYFAFSPDSSDANFLHASDAISCADGLYPRTQAAMSAEARKLIAVAPVMGRFFSYQGAVCAGWPPSPPRFADTAPPRPVDTMLLVSATGDPATPNSWALSAQKHLGNARLLIRDGNGHTSYGTGNSCIDDAVDAYFMKGTLPKTGTRC